MKPELERRLVRPALEQEQPEQGLVQVQVQVQVPERPEVGLGELDAGFGEQPRAQSRQ